MDGLYIAFEGTVGTGKSTQAKKLAAYLKEKYPDKDIVLTREPGGDKVADAIRTAVQGSDFSENMEPVCDAYLYAASRAQTLRSIVLPALKKGNLVISDRSVISSLAYQAEQVGLVKVLEINKHAVPKFPDVVFFINLDPKTGLKRTFDASGDKWEKKDSEFFDELRERYLSLSKLPELKNTTWLTIDGTGSVEEVFERILKSVKENELVS